MNATQGITRRQLRRLTTLYHGVSAGGREGEVDISGAGQTLWYHTRSYRVAKRLCEEMAEESRRFLLAIAPPA